MGSLFDRIGPPLRPGQLPTATETNEVFRAVTESDVQNGTGRTGVSRMLGGTQIRDFTQFDLFARITGSGSGNGPVYTWQQVIRSISGSTWETVPSGLFGTATASPAREINGNRNVPTGVIVRLTPTQGADGFEFQWGEGQESGSGGGTGDRLKGYVVGDVRCENGVQTVYRRADYWDGQGGYYGPLEFWHTAGCCSCSGSGSGSGSGSSGSQAQGGFAGCCSRTLNATLYATVAGVGTAVLTWVPADNVWKGNIALPGCGKTLFLRFAPGGCSLGFNCTSDTAPMGPMTMIGPNTCTPTFVSGTFSGSSPDCFGCGTINVVVSE